MTDYDICPVCKGSTIPGLSNPCTCQYTGIKISEETNKQIHVKPNFYTYCFEELKIIAKKYGYNLVIHGSMNRDMDLIAIPWVNRVADVDEMIIEFAEYLDASIMPLSDKQKYCFPHGRYSYILEMKRTFTPLGNWSEDAQYYLDISVMPTMEESIKPI